MNAAAYLVSIAAAVALSASGAGATNCIANFSGSAAESVSPDTLAEFRPIVEHFFLDRSEDDGEKDIFDLCGICAFLADRQIDKLNDGVPVEEIVAFLSNICALIPGLELQRDECCGLLSNYMVLYPV